MKNKIIFGLMATGLALTSCSDWLDINDDPNHATVETVTASYLMTSVQNDITSDRTSMSGLYNWAQFLTKSGDYSGAYVYLSGQVTSSTFNTYWANRYARLANIRAMKQKAEEAGDKALLGVAQVLEIIQFQELVDLYGDVPYTQASQGNDALNPEYDKAEEIYKNLIAEIQEAEKNLEGASLKPYAAADIYFGGSADKWLQFACSQEVRMLMRVSNVPLFNTVNGSARLQALEGKCLSFNAACNPGYYVGSGKMNPVYNSFGHTYQWTIANGRTGRRATNRSQYDPTEEMVKFLRDTENPLLRVYADPKEKLGSDGYTNYSNFGLADEWYIGVPYGVSSPSQRAYVSLVGFAAAGMGYDFTTGATRDQVIFPECASYFAFAEAALRGLIGGGDAKAKEYYEKGVKAMFNYYESPLQEPCEFAGAKAPISGSAAEAAEEYLTQTEGTYSDMVNWDLMTTDEQKMEAIAVQKWLGFYLIDPQEAWSEIRRTDMPSWLHASHQLTLTSLKIPARCLLPNTEDMFNHENYQKNYKGDIMNDLIFWDTKNPDRAKPGDYLNTQFVNGYEK